MTAPNAAHVTAVRARACIVPLPVPHKTVSGTIEAAPLVLVDVTTDRGVTGVAYGFSYTPLALEPLRAMTEAMGGLLVGTSAAPLDARAMLGARFRLLGMQGLVAMAAAVLDMALWDAAAKAAALPLAEMLGGTRRPVRVYDSLGQMPPDETARMVEASLGAGHRAWKVKAGAPDPRDDLAVVEAIRRVAGEDAWVAIDFNQGFSPVAAARRMEVLDEARLAWLEEPVMTHDHAGHAAVRARVATPIQTGENWWGVADMRASLAAGASDHAMPDAMKIGGVSGFIEAATLAAAEAMPVSSHLFAEVSAHLLAVTPTAHMLEWMDLASPILAEGLAIRDGHLTAPDRPGNGMAWDEAAVERFAA